MNLIIIMYVIKKRDQPFYLGNRGLDRLAVISTSHAKDTFLKAFSLQPHRLCYGSRGGYRNGGWGGLIKVIRKWAWIPKRGVGAGGEQAPVPSAEAFDTI